MASSKVRNKLTLTLPIKFSQSFKPFFNNLSIMLVKFILDVIKQVKFIPQEQLYAASRFQRSRVPSQRMVQSKIFTSSHLVVCDEVIHLKPRGVDWSFRLDISHGVNDCTKYKILLLILNIVSDDQTPKRLRRRASFSNNARLQKFSIQCHQLLTLSIDSWTCLCK